MQDTGQVSTDQCTAHARAAPVNGVAGTHLGHPVIVLLMDMDVVLQRQHSATAMLLPATARFS
jgi:hypothetical protein